MLLKPNVNILLFLMTFEDDDLNLVRHQKTIKCSYLFLITSKVTAIDDGAEIMSSRDAFLLTKFYLFLISFENVRNIVICSDIFVLTNDVLYSVVI